MTPEQLRDAYNRYIDERKQSYVAKMTNINASTLSSFKNGKFDLYPEIHERLETFLNEHRQENHNLWTILQTQIMKQNRQQK